MLRIDGLALYRAFNHFSAIEALNDQWAKDDSKKQAWQEIIAEGDAKGIRLSAEGVKSELVKINATLSLLTIDRLIERIDSEKCTYENVRAFVHSLNGRLADEFGLVKILALSADEAKLYEPTTPHFGTEFEAKFKSGLYELDEAAKCQAFGRPTAAAFHLMRLLEIGVRAVGKSLAIPDPTRPVEKNWGIVLKAIKDAIDRKWPTQASRMAGDGALFESLYASLDAAKNPWRNMTMHVENKYTDDEAEHIFVAVKGFMKKLAARMDEDGLPLA